MQIRSPEVVTLYQQYGCRFVPPTPTQTESVLTALDTALGGWEKSHPELFFQALELNFPELVRRSPVAA
jgi:hypothetical protein